MKILPTGYFFWDNYYIEKSFCKIAVWFLKDNLKIQHRSTIRYSSFSEKTNDDPGASVPAVVPHQVHGCTSFSVALHLMPCIVFYFSYLMIVNTKVLLFNGSLFGCTSSPPRSLNCLWLFCEATQGAALGAPAFSHILIQPHKLSPTVIDFSLCSNLSCGALSKALRKI